MDRPPNSYCANCDKHKMECGKLRRCGKCQRAHYCSKECQVKHWKSAHKDACVKKFMDGMTQHNPAHFGGFDIQLALPKRLLQRGTFTDFFLRSVGVQSDGRLVLKAAAEVIYSLLTGYRTTFQVLDLKVEWFHCHQMAAHRKYELTRRGWNPKHIAENGHGISVTRDSTDEDLGDIVEVLQTSPRFEVVALNCGCTRFDAVKSRFTPLHYAALFRCVSRYVGYDPLQVNAFGVSWSVTADVELRKAIIEAVKAKNKRKIRISDDYLKPAEEIDPKHDVESRYQMQELQQMMKMSTQQPIDWTKLGSMFSQPFPLGK